MIRILIPILTILLLAACKEKGCTDSTAVNFNPDAQKDDGSCTYPSYANAPEVGDSKYPCDQSLSFESEADWQISNGYRIVVCNHIPEHMVGQFPNADNPNSIQPVEETLVIKQAPSMATSKTYVAGESGPQYAIGVALNGVEFDPAAAEAFEHQGQKVWSWTLEATNNDLGLDCSNAHVQPNGEYHYHGTPTEYFSQLNINSNAMTLVGYAADGYPIYYLYAFSDANDPNSSIEAMKSSYELRTGERGGDGVTEPCGSYNGVYVQDYEFVEGKGDLGECNGREGVTPEYPDGTYYYVITDDFPGIPRCFVGTPAEDFKVGP